MTANETVVRCFGKRGRVKDDNDDVKKNKAHSNTRECGSSANHGV